MVWGGEIRQSGNGVDLLDEEWWGKAVKDRWSLVRCGMVMFGR